MPNITLQPEYVFSLFGVAVTNTLLTAVLVSMLLISGAIWYTRQQQIRTLSTRGQRLWYIFVYEMLHFTDAVTGSRALSKRLLPLVATLFLFIFLTNLIALLPGFLGAFYVHDGSLPVALFRSPNSDLTTTFALALITVCAIQYFSIKLLGGRQYLRRYFNFTGVIPFILGLFEALSELMRVLSFSFRLFGNVFAGEVLLLVVAFLVPYVLPVPFMVLEIFVGLIQAYIFATLVLTYIRVNTYEGLVKGG